MPASSGVTSFGTSGGRVQVKVPMTREKSQIDFITVTVYACRYMAAEMNSVTREILLSFWKVHVLHHAAEGPLYGQWVIGELRRHGYEISPGTLYPLLQRMERHGWLKRARHKDAGPRARKNYLLTEEGRNVLRLVRAQVDELHREVVRGSREYRR
jgi:DNA-binding PadR family transcriptional regulator